MSNKPILLRAFIPIEIPIKGAGLLIRGRHYNWGIRAGITGLQLTGASKQGVGTNGVGFWFKV